MIPNQTDVVEITSNITGEVGKFTVDENSLTKIMSVLTNLYSDPEMAVVREYLTNGLDAQIEAQELDPNYVWRPIEITTPSHFNKAYIVRDFGTGMNGDDLRDIYSKYGKSTKEQSNSVTGMLGLGSKCALTYTSQFTITGYKNGVKTVAIVSKDENDTPVFMIVDTSTTKEPNGVEISVPVRDRNTFAQKTKDFLKFWSEGQVLVDGKEPEKHGHKLVKTFPLVRGNTKGDVAIHFIESAGTGYYVETPTSYVVMGNVPYAVDAEYVDEALREANMGYIAYVPMGAVDFPPNREVLQYNTATKEVVKKISEGLFDLVYEEVVKDIINAPDHKTAWERYSALPMVFARHQKTKTLTYKGELFPSRIDHDKHMRLTWDYQGRGQIAEIHQVYISEAMNGALIVTGVDQTTKPTSYFKRKVRYYMSQNGINRETALLVENDINNVWLDWLPRIDAQTIKDIKIPRTPTGNSGPRVEAPFDYWYHDNGKVVMKSEVTIKVPKGKTLVYISPQDMRETYRKQGTHAETLAKKLGDEVYLVVAGKNRFDKFLRTHANAITVKAWVTKKVKDLVDAATDAEYVVAELDPYGEKPFLTKVKASDIDDPDLREVINLVQAPNQTSHFQQAKDLVSFIRRADIRLPDPEKKTVKKTVLNKYPLMKSSTGHRHMDHLVVYINAIYAASQP